MANNALNVSVGKPKVGGAIYTAPLGSTLPTDASTALDNAFVSLGYCSDDGVTESNSPSMTDIKAWGGDVVLTVQEERPLTVQFKMIEVLNENVLKAVYGSENVSGALATGLTVRHNASEVPAAAWVIDMILTDGAIERKVIPNAKLSSLADIVYKDNEAIGYDVTLSAMPGNQAFGYDKMKTYILKA